MTSPENFAQLHEQRRPDAGSQAAGSVSSRHALLAQCFELMADVLGPFIDARMSGYFDDEDSWAEAAANRLGRAHEHGATDPLFQLLVLRRFWGPVFADYFGDDLRGIVGELIETRNKWAHFSLPRDPDSLDRSVLAIERLISPVAPEHCGELRRIRADIRSSPHPPPASVDSTATDRTGTGIETIEVTDTEIDDLAAQLAETETVFQDLQQRYGDVVSRLESSRQVAARKQLHLSALEEQLTLIRSRTTAAEAILADERTMRYRLEWLAVGLLATLTLFLVLANT